MARLLPRTVNLLVTNYEAWIVGSYAAPPDERLESSDIDVVVPLSRWPQAVQLIPRGSTMNSFGGFSFQEDGRLVDVWAGDLGFVMCAAQTKWVWQPHAGIRFKKEFNDS